MPWKETDVWDERSEFIHEWKSGDRKMAMTFYTKALEFNPDHKGALEYQGELFVETGDLTKARENAAKLAKLCPQGCEEREDLDNAIGGAQAKTQ